MSDNSPFRPCVDCGRDTLGRVDGRPRCPDHILAAIQEAERRRDAELAARREAS